MSLLNRLQKWLLRRVNKEAHTVLNGRRVYILPTREGVIFAIMLLVMLAAATNYNNALVFFFTFLITGVAVISMHMTQKNLLGLDFSISHTQPVFCYESLQIPVSIHQTNPVYDHNYCVAIKLGTRQQYADIIRGQKTQLHLSFATEKRGRANIPPMEISTIYPFGLFRAWANVELECDGIIYPAIAETCEFKPQAGLDNEGKSSEGRGYDDFSGFKTYQPGESLRHVHWKAYAKGQGMLSKTFAGGNTQKYWVSWHDIDAAGVEDRLRKLCKVLVDAENRGDQYGLVLPTETIAIEHGYQHLHQCLKALALYRE